MKRLAAILLLFLAMAAPSLAQLAVVTNTTFARLASSYFTSHRTGDYLDSAKYMYWPYLNIFCYEDSRGGDSIQGANEGRMEKKVLAQAANGKKTILEVWSDDNSQYTAAQFTQNISNTFLAPTNLYNGTAYTNEGGWAATNHFSVIVVGSIPYTNNTTAGCPEEIRNNAATNSVTLFGGVLGIELFYQLLGFGWAAAIQPPNALQFGSNPNDGDLTHPGRPGNFDMAIVAAQAETRTNVNTAIIDFGLATVASTNRCYVSSLASSGGVVSFNWIGDGHSMAFDHAGDVLSDSRVVTNDVTPAFTVTPALSNAFFEEITFTNVPNGSYKLTEGGTVIWYGSVTNNRLDVNLFPITLGPLWAQRIEVLRLIRQKRHCDEITLVDGPAGDAQGEIYYDSAATTAWNAGNRGDALIAALATPMANLNAKDAAIWTAATPTNIQFALTPLPIIYFPAHRP